MTNQFMTKPTTNPVPGKTAAPSKRGSCDEAAPRRSSDGQQLHFHRPEKQSGNNLRQNIRPRPIRAEVRACNLVVTF